MVRKVRYTLSRPKTSVAAASELAILQSGGSDAGVILGSMLVRCSAAINLGLLANIVGGKGRWS